MRNILITFLLFCSLQLFSQDGALDNTFNVGSGANQNVYLAKQLADGKILIGGQFTNYNGNASNAIARLNNDGSFDNTFNIGSGIDFRVLDALIETDGKIVIVGEFYQFNGINRNCILRLNMDGTLDTSFNITTSNIIEIGKVSKQNDKYIITGSFTSINNNPSNHIARLNYDGTSDLTFNSLGLNNSSGISRHLILSNGKIVIVGAFSFYQGVSRKNIARLNADGTLDTSFDPGTGTSAAISSLAMQSDGKYIIGGTFSAYNGITKFLLARINEDGSLDTSFTIPNGYNLSATSIIIDNNDKIIAGGFQTSVSGNGNYLARLNSDGTFDSNFSTGTDFDNAINTLSFQTDGKILVGGWFSSYNGVDREKIIRLNNTNALSSSSYLLENNFKVYPNPFLDFLTIDSELFTSFKYDIVDSFGKLIKSGSTKFKKLNLVDLNSGIYFLKCYNDTDFVIRKIIKN